MVVRPNFGEAVSRLNAKGLLGGLATCSALSLCELAEGPDTPLFPALNQEKVRLLGDALLRSKAAEYKTGVISGADLVYVLNGCNDAQDDKRIKAEVPNNADKTLMLYRFNIFLSRMFFFQIRLQQLFFEDFAGRLIAILVGLARERLEAFPEEVRPLVSRMPATIESALGTSVETLSAFPAAIQTLALETQADLSRGARALFDRASGLTIDRQVEAIKSVAREAQRDPERLTFDAISVASRLAFANLPDVDACLGVYASSTVQMRETLVQPEFAKGPDGWRLSPLARFPIVKIKGTRPYIVPNFRYLLRNFPDVAHFYLQSRLNEEEYNQYRGAVHEVYIAECLRDRLPALEIVRERKYDRPGAAQVRGPDAVAIDVPDRSIVAIECKARRISVNTRINLSDEALQTSFGYLESVLTQLRTKIDELYGGLPVYTDVQAKIDATDKDRTVCVIVLGETVTQLTRLIRAGLAVKGGLLASFPYPFCIVDVEAFERAVEIAAAEGISLALLFREYWDESGEFEVNRTLPEDFSRHVMPLRSLFAESFLPAAWREAKARAAIA